jgi:sarcosine oxidase subunit gamma
LKPGRHGKAEGEAGIFAAPRPGMAVIALLVRRGQFAALTEKFRAQSGLDLPPGPHRATAGDISVVSFAPGRWLFLQENSDPAGLAARLATELAGLASVVDLSDARCVLRLWGPKLRAVLAKGLPIDIHPERFGPNDAAASMIALIDVQLWQLDDRPCFELAVPRSYASSLAGWLIASAGEYGLEV